MSDLLADMEVYNVLETCRNFLVGAASVYNFTFFVGSVAGMTEAQHYDLFLHGITALLVDCLKMIGVGDPPMSVGAAAMALYHTRTWRFFGETPLYGELRFISADHVISELLYRLSVLGVAGVADEGFEIMSAPLVVAHVLRCIMIFAEFLQMGELGHSAVYAVCCILTKYDGAPARRQVREWGLSALARLVKYARGRKKFLLCRDMLASVARDILRAPRADPVTIRDLCDEYEAGSPDVSETEWARSWLADPRMRGA